MDIPRINLHLTDYGYDFLFHADGRLLSEEELNSSSRIDGKTFLSILSSEEHPLCQLLLLSRTIVDILCLSLNYADYSIPSLLQYADEFELVTSKRQQKRLHGNVKNGLYDFVADFSDDLGFAFKRIQRKDKSIAFIIEPTPGPNHLTIDEYYVTQQATGRFIHHYAHISMIKDEARVRVYFNDELKVVKTTAHLEEDGVKIAKLDVSKLNIQASDYSEFFLILSELHQSHQDKIQELNIAFTPLFMFIKDAETLANCRLKIAIINRLKSPYYDFREELLTSDRVRTPVHSELSVLSEETESLSIEAPTVMTAHGNALDKVEKKQVSKKERKQQQKLAAIGAIDAAFAGIEYLLISATQENLNVNQALDEILQLEFLMIYYSKEIEDEQTAYEHRIEICKLRCLDILHMAFIACDFDFLSKSYEHGKLFIDSIIYHYLIELVSKLNEGLSFSSSDKEKFKKLTNLLQFYYEKNELFEGFFVYLKKQLAYNPRLGTIYSFIMRMIHALDDPAFIQFLIHKHFISASDCICVLKYKYISLQQYMLLIAGELNSNYLSFLQFLLTENADILAITKTSLFEKLLKNPQEYRIGTYRVEGGRFSRNISADKSIDALHLPSRNIQPTSTIDFCQLHGYHILPDPWQLVCQDFFILNPILALNYLSVLITSKSINRRVLRSIQPEVQIFLSMDEMDAYTLGIAFENEEEKLAVSYLFYPINDAPANIYLQLQCAQNLLERIKSQPYMREMRNDNGIMMEFMNELKKVETADQKLTLVMSAITYLTMMPWCINTFKKYVFFQLYYIETLVEISQGSLIIPHIQLMTDMIKAFVVTP